MLCMGCQKIVAQNYCRCKNCQKVCCQRCAEKQCFVCKECGGDIQYLF